MQGSRFPAIPATIQGVNAPAPGRVNTYFNSPYAAGIANNLSAAIYGDPQADLTRQQIIASQKNQARIAEQDRIAAEETARTRQLQEELGAVLATGGDLTKAIPAFIQGGGDLGDALTLMGMDDPRYRQKAGMVGVEGAEERKTYGANAGVKHGYDVNLKGVDLENDLIRANVDLGNDLFRGDIEHQDELELLGLEQGFDEGQNRLDRGDAIVRALIPQGLYNQDLASAVAGPEAGSISISDLPRWAEAQEAKNRGKGGSTTLPNGTQIKAFSEDLAAELGTILGAGDDGIAGRMDPEQYQRFMQFAAQEFSRTGDAAAAKAAALREFKIGVTPSEWNLLSPNVPSQLSITPTNNDPLGILNQ